MKLLKKNQSGFTLMEVVTAVGIVAIMALVVMNAKRTSDKTMSVVQRNNDINEVIQYLTTELSKQEVCEKNFSTKAVAASYTSLVDRNGTTIFQTGPYNSVNANGGQKFALNIVSIATTAGGGNKMNLTVTYKLTAKLWEAARANETFVIPINVYLTNGAISSCYSDLQSALATAVSAACQGNGAKYINPDASYPYGHCEHEIALTVGGTPQAPVSNVFSCPAGQVLQNIDTSANKMSFTCVAVTANSAACPAFSYVKGYNADGTLNCQDVRTIFPNSGFMVIRGTTLVVQNISCPGGNTILRKINADGSLDCVNPRLSQACPPNYYAGGGVNPDGSVTCVPAGNSACSAGMYIKSIDAAGTVSCAYPYIPGSCAAGTVMNGLDASGNVTCVTNPP